MSTNTNDAAEEADAASVPTLNRRDNTAALGDRVPSKHLAFPQWGNITAVEILVFFPLWLHSYDILFRLVANGMTVNLACQIINHHRIFPKHPVRNNTINKMLQNVMRNVYGIPNWTVGTHHTLIPQDWRRDRLDFAGFKLQCEDCPDRFGNRRGVVRGIPFKDLMIDVVKMPQGDDALDLTRCIAYAVKHPEIKLMFPEDFYSLVIHLGGPKKIKKGNWDREVFAYWEGKAKFIRNPSKTRVDENDQEEEMEDDDASGKGGAVYPEVASLDEDRYKNVPIYSPLSYMNNQTIPTMVRHAMIPLVPRQHHLQFNYIAPAQNYRPGLGGGRVHPPAHSIIRPWYLERSIQAGCPLYSQRNPMYSSHRRFLAPINDQTPDLLGFKNNSHTTHQSQHGYRHMTGHRDQSCPGCRPSQFVPRDAYRFSGIVNHQTHMNPIGKPKSVIIIDLTDSEEDEAPTGSPQSVAAQP